MFMAAKKYVFIFPKINRWKGMTAVTDKPHVYYIVNSFIRSLDKIDTPLINRQLINTLCYPCINVLNTHYLEYTELTFIQVVKIL